MAESVATVLAETEPAASSCAVCPRARALAEGTVRRGHPLHAERAGCVLGTSLSMSSNGARVLVDAALAYDKNFALEHVVGLPSR
jgi:hypothetical protein